MDHSSTTWALGVGIIACLAGYILTLGVQVIQGLANLTPHAYQELQLTYIDMAAWSFYNGHFVGISGGERIVFSENYRMLAVTNLSNIAIFGIPILVLLAAGFVLGARSPSADGTHVDGALRGAQCCLGYGIAALVGAALVNIQILEVESGIIGGLRPDIGFTILLMGIAYPVIWGGIGGALAVTARRRWPTLGRVGSLSPDSSR